MKPMHAIAAAVIALAGLGLSAPAEAAPKDVAGVAVSAGDVLLAGHRDRDDRRDWRHGRDDRRDWDRDRGQKHGWDRGRGHDRHWRDDRRKKAQKHWGKQHARWRLHHHPHRRHWLGRHFAWRGYDHIRHHDRYGLRPPPHGHFYARIDNDVFLVAEATRRIIDAFVLVDAVGR